MWKWTKSKKQNKEIAFPYGYYLDASPSSSSPNLLLICLLKSVLIFLATLGSLGCLISAFDIDCHIALLCLILFPIAVFSALLHYNKLSFNLGYPVLFFLFAFSIFEYKNSANAGYQFILAKVQNAYSDYFHLSSLREAESSYYDSTIACTTTLFFIGFFLIVMLNIAVSEYMSFIILFILTFPIVQFGIYIDRSPSPIYFCMLLLSYLSVLILKFSRHYTIPYNSKSRENYVHKSQKNKQIFSYQVNFRMLIELIALMLVLTLFTITLSTPFLSKTINGKTSALRKKADNYVQIFVVNGVSGLFDRYEATGGISNGQLGGIANVRPDYEPDLSVTFVPVASETVYLKAFTGCTYEGDKWLKPLKNTSREEYTGDLNISLYDEYCSRLEASRLLKYMKDQDENDPNVKHPGIFSKMKIENLDANPDYLYLPYYTYTSDTPNRIQSYSNGIMQGSLKTGKKMTVNYFPLISNYWDLPNYPDALLSSLPKDSFEYKSILSYTTESSAEYLQFPEEITPQLNTVKEDIGTASSINEQVGLIQNYFNKNYTYSTSPGKTPTDEDFVGYFLSTQKKGYCSHFASAATLLLRSYGIPARYVEGYVIKVSDLADAKMLTKNTENWLTGTNPIPDSGVFNVNIPDANAHAWVEVFMQGIGWVPYEFTPPSDEAMEDSSYSGFLRLLSGFLPHNMQNRNDTSSSEATPENSDYEGSHTLPKSTGFFYPLFMFCAALGILLIIMSLIPRILFRIRLQRSFVQGDYAPLIAFHYQKICRLLKTYKMADTDILLPSDLEGIISDPQNTPVFAETASLHENIELLYLLCYSNQTTTKKEADSLLLFLKKIYKYVRKM